MAKNLLQNLCVSKGYPNPVYETSRRGGSIKTPLWSSLVKLNRTPCDSEVFLGGDHLRKKGAEENAAQNALNALSSLREGRIPSPGIIVEVKSPTVLMVDLENMPSIVAQLPVFKGPIDVYIFVGKHHPLADEEYHRPGMNIVKAISPSTRPGGSDTFMQLHAGIFLSSKRYDKYLIATRDRFGSALAELISTKTLTWEARPAAVVTTINHILEEL